jgi:putative FmdB family regulatory protein
MPIYEYQCRACGEVVTAIRPVSERDRVASCKVHGTASMVRKVSASNFALKGGGWYRDGYSKK